MIVVVCPGQGAQTPGFLQPWLDIPIFREAIETMQHASGVDLLMHGTVSDADTIRDTAIAQPLIVGAGIASLKALLSGRTAAESGISGVAGHSVGEVTAAFASGIFSESTAINFVNERGRAMAEAAAIEPSSMAAILGGDINEVEAHLLSLGLEPANYNGSGQIVAAGSANAIEALVLEPLAGTRVIPLQVAGAFHTRYMNSAVQTLRDYAKGIEANEPTISLWSNNGGSQISSGAAFVDLMVDQISSPVRWDLCMQAMVNHGVTALIELAPAGTLTGLAKRGMPGVETLAVKSPENIDAALSLIDNHR